MGFRFVGLSALAGASLASAGLVASNSTEESTTHEEPAGAICALHYPDDLSSYDVAFAGTVLSWHVMENVTPAPATGEVVSTPAGFDESELPGSIRPSSPTEPAANGPADPDELAVRLRYSVRIDVPIRGITGSTTDVYTWDFDGEIDADDHVGDQFLIATNPSHELQFCGFTRPHTAADLQHWVDVLD